MQGPDPTTGRGRLGAWSWLLVVASATAAPAWGQGPTSAEEAAPAADLVALAAERVRFWDAGPVRWVLLEGQAGVFVETEGLWAERVLVRVSPDANSGWSWVEAFAEGNVQLTERPGSAVRSGRLVWRSARGVEPKPHQGGQPVQLAGPPHEALDLQRRGFPNPPPVSCPPVSLAQAMHQPVPRQALEVGRAALARPAALAAEVSIPTAPTPFSTEEAAPAPLVVELESPVPIRDESQPPEPEDASHPNSGSESGDLPDLEPVPVSEPKTDSDSESGAVSPSGPGPTEMPTPVFLPADDSVSPPGADPREPAPQSESEPRDSDLTQAQFSQPLGALPALDNPNVSLDPLPPDLRPLEDFPEEPDTSNSLAPGPIPGATPGPGPGAAPGARRGGERPAPIGSPSRPAQLGSQRIIRFRSRSGGKLNVQYQTSPDGTVTILITGGVVIVGEIPQVKRSVVRTPDGKIVPLVVPAPKKIVDLSADSAVIWTRQDPHERPGTVTADGELAQDASRPVEVYLEGHVLILQDRGQVAGDGDRSTFRAGRAYYDFRSERLLALEGEVSHMVPGMISPMKIKASQILQYHAVERFDEAGKPILGPTHLRADEALMTGSRFPNPGYQFNTQAVDITQVRSRLADPNTGTLAGNPDDPDGPDDLSWDIDARQNFFWLGNLPVFYWPRILTNSEDLDPPMRNLIYQFNTYFGQQFLTDWNAFKLFGLRKPRPNRRLVVDGWNIDLDYLSYRGPAAGSEFAYFGRELIPGYAYNHFGYIDLWGIIDHGQDDLGSGPAIITDGPPGAGLKGIQRLSIPVFQSFRGRIVARHMQSFLSQADLLEDDLQDFRAQLEVAKLSDRHFLNQYYKRLFDFGLDQSTLLYVIRQKENHAWTALTEANLQPWYTESQWLPKLDYYRLGDAPFGNLFTYYHHSGVDWANTHTANEVANTGVFNFIPYDPVSLTSGPLSTGRIYTSHELDLPLDLKYFRLVPYVQGQLVGWNNQYQTGLPPLRNNYQVPNQLLVRNDQGDFLGRAWGAAGIRANVMLWRAFPDVNSELFNVHSLNHKINFDADYRDSWANFGVGRIGIQDDLDDNTYEFVRRYFAMQNYVNGVLPAQYNPLLLYTRRTISPITGTTDVQTSMNSLQLGIRQRLQTKRGPEGRRRPVDWMLLDLTTTYYPYARRDNFGKPFGQNMYNYEWFIGDRTSIVSYGWFEMFDIQGVPKTNLPDRKNSPFSFSVVTAGVSLNRPPRGNIYIGYSVINTGPIATSALTSSYAYWLSPKWYTTFGTSYDFGNAILLGSTFSFTRIGADFLTSIGFNVNPLQQSYGVNVELVPRFSPNIRLGSTSASNRFDSRYAPTQ